MHMATVVCKAACDRNELYKNVFSMHIAAHPENVMKSYVLCHNTKFEEINMCECIVNCVLRKYQDLLQKYNLFSDGNTDMIFTNNMSYISG